VTNVKKKLYVQVFRFATATGKVGLITGEVIFSKHSITFARDIS